MPCFLKRLSPDSASPRISLDTTEKPFQSAPQKACPPHQIMGCPFQLANRPRNTVSMREIQFRLRFFYDGNIIGFHIGGGLRPFIRPSQRKDIFAHWFKLRKSGIQTLNDLLCHQENVSLLQAVVP